MASPVSQRDLTGEPWERLFPFLETGDRSANQRSGAGMSRCVSDKRMPALDKEGPEGLHRDFTGDAWERLFPFLEDGTKSEPPGRVLPRTLCDVKRVPSSDMGLFEHRPETDPFITIACCFCSKLVLPMALRKHIEKHHTEGEIASLRAKTVNLALSETVVVKEEPPQPQPPPLPMADPTLDVVCSLCSMTVLPSGFRRHALKAHGDDPAAKPLQLAAALKIKTAKKPTPSKKSTSKSASSSPPELNEEISKDSVKKLKSKKSKSPIPPELEAILPEPGKRGALPRAAGPPDLLPADQPKRSSKKKSEKKADKVYDPDKNCGVINETGKPCLRSIFCKVHLVAHKRAVPSRSMAYDALAKLMKSQNDVERRPKLEVPVAVVPVDITPPMSVLEPMSEVWPEPTEMVVEEEAEPDVKRIKTEDIAVVEELPSDIEALIEETLQADADADTEVSLACDLPVTPRPEPVARWSLEEPMSPPTPPPPPFVVADMPWHSTHPRPLATNTFGCRLVGGLLTKNKKLDEFRKHLQSVWGAPMASPEPKTCTVTAKAGTVTPVKKSVVTTPKRKRKNSGSSSVGGVTPDLFSGVLQRAASAAANATTAATPPAAPPNGINGVPLRLLNNNNMANSQSTFIQLNLALPSKN